MMTISRKSVNNVTLNVQNASKINSIALIVMALSVLILQIVNAKMHILMLIMLIVKVSQKN
jgi:hypothetical protein